MDDTHSGNDVIVMPSHLRSLWFAFIFAFKNFGCFPTWCFITCAPYGAATLYTVLYHSKLAGIMSRQLLPHCSTDEQTRSAVKDAVSSDVKDAGSGAVGTKRRRSELLSSSRSANKRSSSDPVNNTEVCADPDTSSAGNIAKRSHLSTQDQMLSSVSPDASAEKKDGIDGIDGASDHTNHDIAKHGSKAVHNFNPAEEVRRYLIMIRYVLHSSGRSLRKTSRHFLPKYSSKIYSGKPLEVALARLSVDGRQFHAEAAAPSRREAWYKASLLILR